MYIYKFYTLDKMNKKIGVNTKCPCNSGKKYKKCCLVEEKKSSQRMYQANDLKRVYSEVYTTMEENKDKSNKEKNKIFSDCILFLRKEELSKTMLQIPDKNNASYHLLDYDSFRLYTKIMANDALRKYYIYLTRFSKNDNDKIKIVNRYEHGSTQCIYQVKQELDREERIAKELEKSTKISN